MAEDMFDGFDHTQYKDEVEQRWGKKAYADSDRWWRGMSADEKSAWKQRVGRSGPRLDRRGRERQSRPTAPRRRLSRSATWSG